MTTRTRRQLWILGALILVVVAIVVFRPAPAGVEGVGTTAPPTDRSAPSRPDAAVGDVRLDLLESRADTSAGPERNLFRFEARRSSEAEERPEPAPVARLPEPTGPPPPSTPPPPPPPPPIPLRYIGYVEEAGQVARVAVLSDGRGNVFNGKEGDIIEGRYRLLRIGTDSADLIYVDGRGRQTIRLSGQ